MGPPFLPVDKLNVGAFDAVNYSGRKEKGFLSKIFLRDSALEAVIETKRYFLVGEKGTGKTAYATFISNSDYKNFTSSVKNLAATDYARFIKLKSLGHLQVSSYEDVWKAILLLLSSAQIRNKESNVMPTSGKFQKIQSAIDQYYNAAFDPEIVNAIEFVENAEVTAGIITDVIKVGAKAAQSVKLSGNGFQTSLLHLERQFKDAIGSLKLKKDHILFIDGIDIRPSEVDFGTYIECIKGLANAAWNLNTDFFSNVRDSIGRIKIVLLLRPDIFNAINFHNSNAKMRDNAVNLTWDTTYNDYRTSRLFRLIDGILSKQQASGVAPNLGEAWDNYFNYSIINRRIAEREDNPFIGFLRNSFYRPRDIISYISILQEYVKEHRPGSLHFVDSDFVNCQSSYSEYLLGEVKDHLAFYHSDADFDELTGFFTFLNGRSSFDWPIFTQAYNSFKTSNARKSLTIKELQSGPEELMQFLYSMNVIGYGEHSSDKLANFVHWSFRDRTAVKLNPKIPFGLLHTGSMPYSVHPGLVRALKVGGTA